MKNLLRFIIILVIFIINSAILSEIKNKSKTCLHEKNLVNQVISPKEISKNHRLICDENIRYFSGKVQAHISTFYNKGKELALTYARKIDIISPTWYFIDLSEKGYVIVKSGSTNYSDFYQQLKSANPNIKIVPKLGFKENAISHIYMQRGRTVRNLAEIITNFTNENKFDGIELDTGPYILQAALHDYLADLLKEISANFHDNKNQILIMTIFLHRTLGNPIIDLDIFGELNAAVDYFNLLSIDFGHSFMNSPNIWAINAILSIQAKKNTTNPEKILVSTPFGAYGFREDGTTFKQESIALKFLWEENSNSEVPNITWDAEAKEHSVTYREMNMNNKRIETVTVVMPSLMVFCIKVC